MPSTLALVEVGARSALGLVFVVAVASKVVIRGGWAGYRRALTAYLPGAPAALVPVLLGLEAAVPVLLAVPATVRAGFGLAVVLLAGFTAGAAIGRARGVAASCACFGPRARPPGSALYVRNAVLLVLSGAGAAVTGAATSGPAGGARAVATAAGVVLAVLLISLDDLAGLLRAPADLPTGEATPWSTRSRALS